MKRDGDLLLVCNVLLSFNLLESFAFRQFDDPNYSGSKINMNKHEFTQKVCNCLIYFYISKVNSLINDETKLHDGYAPFCKHIFLQNFTDAVPGCVEITESIKPLIVSDYISRRSDELPVLSRWIPKEHIGTLAPAKYLDLILYSKEQCIKESAGMNMPPPPQNAPDWLIISIKAQNENHELPMAPITMMRNTLISEGGSGVEIDRAAYKESVEYWKSHVLIQ